jgi:hypothetical protein
MACGSSSGASSLEVSHLVAAQLFAVQVTGASERYSQLLYYGASSS